MSAVAEVKDEAPVEASPRIVNPGDVAILKGLGADMLEPALVAEYFEYRSLPSQGPGHMEIANLRTMRVNQIRRQNKQKGK